MARFVDVIDLRFLPIAAVDYLEGFQHAAEWDPGVIGASLLDPAALRGPGSRFADLLLDLPFQRSGRAAALRDLSQADG